MNYTYIYIYIIYTYVYIYIYYMHMHMCNNTASIHFFPNNLAITTRDTVKILECLGNTTLIQAEMKHEAPHMPKCSVAVQCKPEIENRDITDISNSKIFTNNHLSLSLLFLGNNIFCLVKL